MLILVVTFDEIVAQIQQHFLLQIVFLSENEAEYIVTEIRSKNYFFCLCI